MPDLLSFDLSTVLIQLGRSLRLEDRGHLVRHLFNLFFSELIFRFRLASFVDSKNKHKVNFISPIIARQCLLFSQQLIFVSLSVAVSKVDFTFLVNCNWCLNQNKNFSN